MDFKGKRVLVVGLARTGIAVARFLLKRGAYVFVTDIKPLHQIPEAVSLLEHCGDRLMVVPHSEEALDGMDLVIPSPGVPPNNVILRAASGHVKVLSEIEVAARFLKRPIIAVTGTNGKTTTVSLTGFLLEQGGMHVFVGGNIGNPLISYVDGPQEDDYCVVEVSSFQLQWVNDFHPYIAANLNVTNDHLDYHGSMDEYRAAKERIFANQTERDYAVLNASDARTSELRSTLRSNVVVFSSGGSSLDCNVYLQNNAIHYINTDGSSESYPLSILSLKGRHNAENAMAAIAIARLCGCSVESIKKSLPLFRTLPHRIEFAGQVRGVEFYDDSKSTNVDSVRRALETFEDRSVILLMGGKDKDGDFASLRNVIKKRVKNLVLFGEARDKIAKSLEDTVSMVVVPRLRDGIYEAYSLALPGEIVLLSPGCASFDEFRDYRERGEFFKSVVREIGRSGG
ncbi:MAG: UDP-N-acetylmuramoyl-L-alanine--D-glutamate ligase [Syntrophales bacterium]|nr:UDP-N-acetylmuramoyl-L-alanine--D-glutamate ligase [Syntrophales bacterium]